MDRGAWRATVHGVAESRKWLSDSHFHFQETQGLSRWFLSGDLASGREQSQKGAESEGAKRWWAVVSDVLDGLLHTWKTIWIYIYIYTYMYIYSITSPILWFYRWNSTVCSPLPLPSLPKLVANFLLSSFSVTQRFNISTIHLFLG